MIDKGILDVTGIAKLLPFTETISVVQVKIK